MVVALEVQIFLAVRIDLGVAVDEIYSGEARLHRVEHPFLIGEIGRDLRVVYHYRRDGAGQDAHARPGEK